MLVINSYQAVDATQKIGENFFFLFWPLFHVKFYCHYHSFQDFEMQNKAETQIYIKAYVRSDNP